MNAPTRTRAWPLLVAVLTTVACGSDGHDSSDLFERFLEANLTFTDAFCACLEGEEQRACLDNSLYSSPPEELERYACQLREVERHGEEAFVECENEGLIEVRDCLNQAGCDEDARAMCDPDFQCTPVTEATMIAIAEVCSPLPLMLCDDGELVPMDSRCNGIEDCVDRSDELNCP